MGQDNKMVSITRTFDAPRELVFKAWSNADQLMRWFAPSGCDLAIKSMDFRPGGSLHCCILNPVRDCWTTCVYKEIVHGEKIAFTMAVADEDGRLKSAVEAGMDPEWPDETLVTVTFTEEAGRTTMHLYQTVSEELAKKTGAHPSWLSMFDRLDVELASVAV